MGKLRGAGRFCPMYLALSHHTASCEFSGAIMLPEPLFRRAGWPQAPECRGVRTAFGGSKMIKRFLLLSTFVLFSSTIVDTPRSLAATNDPASVVGDLGSRAIAAMRTQTRSRPSRSCSG